MKLYHYAKQLFPTLKTLRAQGNVTEEQLMKAQAAAELRGSPGLYIDQISFFLDPLPLNVIAQLFEGYNHHTWSAGVTVYEYVVDSKTFGDFPFIFVETPFDVHFRDTEWPSNETDANKKRYFDTYSSQKIHRGEQGKGNHAFEKMAKTFVGKTLAAFQQAVLVNDEDQWRQYAANVPHVQAYPIGGIVKPLMVPRKETIQLMARPMSARW